jgi:hypothetical protein
MGTVKPMRKRNRAIAVKLAAATGIGALVATQAIPQTRPSLNLYGGTGLIDMPSAEMQPDGELSVTVGAFGPIFRSTLTFQMAPRIQGSFRYTGVRGLTLGGFGPNDTYYDRSFDIRIQLLREGRYRPAVALGLQDFAGTGNFAGEYLVATKSLVPGFKVTGGIGWGRFGSRNPIGSPFGPRPGASTPTGGNFNAGQWFRGPAALFGGVEWQVNDRLGLKAEYSSDAYTLEAGAQNLFAMNSPFNFGAEYQVTEAIRLGAYYLYGSRLGISASIALNPKTRPAGSVGYTAPVPIIPRPDRGANPGAWSPSLATAPGAAEGARGRLAAVLSADGMVLEALALDEGRAQLRVRNNRYDAEAQAIGRAARAMAAVLPASVEVFEIVPVVQGMGTSRVILRRSDLEALEHAPDAAAALRARVQVADAGPMPAGAIRGEGLYPRFSWSLAPYIRTALFDPENPFRIDVGLRAQAAVDIAPGLILSGSVTQKLAGNLDQSTRTGNSRLPPVRTDSNRYDRVGTALERLTLAWYARPAANVYSRVTVGYLERMYGGVSAEILWKPVDRRLALGAEVNWAKQRDFDQGFGFRNYSVATGHVSAYYDFGGGYLGQVDVGRYLAGDWGATVSLDREFANGWRVGAFATLTDVPFSTFGEGSFDKGIRLTIPLSGVAPVDSRLKSTVTLRPVQRDGGARLEVDGRLYESVRDYHTRSLDTQWGRVWR